MKHSYNKLWALLLKRRWSKEFFRRQTGGSEHTMKMLRRGEPPLPERTLERICKTLRVKPEDIRDVVDD